MKKDFSFKSSLASVQVRRNTLSMETLGVFEALAEHVCFGLKLELKHDVII